MGTIKAENAAPKTQKKKGLPAAAKLMFCLCGLLVLTIGALFALNRMANKPVFSIGGNKLYDASDGIAQALERFSAGGGTAELVTNGASSNQKVALAFQGTASPEAMKQILDLLAAYDKEASFFVSGINASEDEDSVLRAVQDGHTVGSYGLRGEKHMESKDGAALVEDFARASNIIETITGHAPTRMMCNVTKHTDELRRAAWAAGIEAVDDTAHYVSFQSFSSYSQVESYINKLPRASIVAVKLEGPLDETELEPPDEDDKPAEDMQQTIDASREDAIDMESLTDEERLLLIVEWLLKALDNTNYLPEAADLIEKNQGALCAEMTDIRTTRRAAALLFYGLGNQAELDYLLDVLDELDARGTFLVTEKEAANYPVLIKAVIARGHDLGVAVKQGKTEDAYTYCSQILRCQAALKERYGYEKALSVKLPYGAIDDSVREAVSAAGCVLLSHDTSVSRDRDKNADDAEAVYASIFGEKRLVLHRGHLVYFRMNFYKGSDTLLGELARMIATRNSVYPIESANTILADKELMYNYPLQTQEILPNIRDKIYAGQLRGDIMDIVEKYYVGNSEVRASNKLPGFTAPEIRRIDHTGRIQNDENAVFLTFDDWGSDDTITKLLDVLRKHGAKATFFVRTNNIHYNPNLLRAIALEGHDIGSHTDGHFALATDDNKDMRYDSITPDQQQALRADLVRSYQTLQSVIGDVEVDGLPALTTIFRPPTLAVSRLGMETVFDCGFTYIVSGAYTSGDYEAKSTDWLLSRMRSNIRQSGTIAVLHMSDNSLYTAEAVDAFLTENAAKPQAQRFVCRRLSDYLDGSYSNAQR